jgi:hypothetical protein
VAQPKVSRPARTVVGAAFGSDTVNAQTAAGLVSEGFREREVMQRRRFSRKFKVEAV